MRGEISCNILIWHAKKSPIARPELSFAFTATMLAAYVMLTAVSFGTLLLAALQVELIKDNIFSLLGITLFFLPIAILFVYNMIIKRSDLAWKQLGFVRPGRRLFHLFWQVPLLFVALILTQALVFALTGSEPTGSNALDDLPIQVNTLLAVLAGIAICTLIPIVEETLFRGTLYKFTRERFGIVTAVLCSGGIFAAFHLTPILIPYMLTLGIGLALIYEFHKTLWASVLVHGLLNSAITLALVTSLS